MTNDAIPPAARALIDAARRARTAEDPDGIPRDVIREAMEAGLWASWSRATDEAIDRIRLAFGAERSDRGVYGGQSEDRECSEAFCAEREGRFLRLIGDGRTER